MEPWELKLEEEYRGTPFRYWLGWYYDEKGQVVENAVTVDWKKDGKWIQCDQYALG